MIIRTIDLVEDICPITEFRSEINTMIQKTKETHRPIILTQHGKSTAVVVDIADYQRMVEKSELAQDIAIAEKQFKEGKTYTTAQAKARIMKRFANV
jgi:antitoxin YefM